VQALEQALGIYTVSAATSITQPIIRRRTTIIWHALPSDPSRRHLLQHRTKSSRPTEGRSVRHRLGRTPQPPTQDFVLHSNQNCADSLDQDRDLTFSLGARLVGGLG